MKNRNQKKPRKKRLYECKTPTPSRAGAKSLPVRAKRKAGQNMHRSHRSREKDSNHRSQQYQRIKAILIQRMSMYWRIKEGLHERMQSVLQAYKHDVMRHCGNDASITSKRTVIKAILETNATVARMQSFYARQYVLLVLDRVHRNLVNSIDTTR